MHPDSNDGGNAGVGSLSSEHSPAQNHAQFATYWTDSDCPGSFSDMDDEEMSKSIDARSPIFDQIVGESTPSTFGSSKGSFRGSLKQRRGNTISSSCDESDRDTETEAVGRAPRKPSCPIEKLPTELLQKIACEAYSDADLRSLTSSSPFLAAGLISDESDVWRKRFLALYDYPIINDIHEFAVAYKLRSSVLRNFSGFGGSEDDETIIPLETIKDMVLEAYNVPRNNVSADSRSRNLDLMSDPETSPWILTFFSTPLPARSSIGNDRLKVLYESLQLVLSHLVLSPASRIIGNVKTNRQNYDISRVYNFNRPFTTLYTEGLNIADESSIASASNGISSLNLNSHRPGFSQGENALDMTSLLHIRNFWQRHLTEVSDPFSEHTYALMAAGLMNLNMSPRCWESQLQEQSDLGHKWVGTYSSVNPWPKHLGQLEDTQCSADQGDPIDPMELDLVFSDNNASDCFWPPEFASIPVFRQTVPNTSKVAHSKITYIRGICTFIDLEASQTNGSSLKPEESPKSAKYHPFTACRVRGLIHDIAPPAFQNPKSPKKMKRKRRRTDKTDNESPSEYDVGIPGWKRIIMINYQPTTQYLLQVLEHAEEDYGGAFATEVTALHNTSNLWNDVDTSNNGVEEASDAIETSPTSSEISSLPLSDEEQQQHLETILTRRLASFTEKYERLVSTSSSKSSPTKLPPLFSPQHIITLEDSFSPPAYISWDDGVFIANAYAYEGIIIPGGKIAMGRWWRCHGTDGLGPGKEVGIDGVGVEVRPIRHDDLGQYNDGTGKANVRASDDKFEIVTNVTGTGEVIGSEGFGTGGSKGLERGPFVFWAV